MAQTEGLYGGRLQANPFLKACDLVRFQNSKNFETSPTKRSWGVELGQAFMCFVAIAFAFTENFAILFRETSLRKRFLSKSSNPAFPFMNVKDRVEKELQNGTVGTARAFALRCAIRALPFIGASGDFEFWEEIDRQKFLFKIFFALDIAMYLHDYPGALFYEPSEFYGLAAEASDNAMDVSLSTNTDAYPAAAVAMAVSFATNAISDNTYTSPVQAAANTFAAANHRGIDLSPIIFQDIKTITDPKISPLAYGEIWEKFLFALHKHRCGYWAKVYEGIFQNNFTFDSQELFRRINVPKEIQEKGASAVGAYMEILAAEGATRLNEARIIILGNKGAGKTCVARRLGDPEAEMTKPSESTAGVDTSSWLLVEENIHVRIWDFAGHTVTHAVHQFFLAERCLYLLVYDGRTDDLASLEYWLTHIQNYGGNAETIILVNKRDPHEVQIPINTLKEKYSIAGCHALNVQEDIEELLIFRAAITDYIRHKPAWENQKIPISYYLVKEALENRFQKEKALLGEEFISKKDFLAIAEQFEVQDPETLLGDLHLLGVSLWYQEMEDYQTLVLNPEWISQGVYQIINWVGNEKRHSLKLADFAPLFQPNRDRFPAEKDQFLFDLIKHYELAYETEENGELIIPHLLNEDQPEQLPVFDQSSSLMIKYESDQVLPLNTISRFIVRHHLQIKSEGRHPLVWKYGVILQVRGALALVREVDRSIVVSVKGKKQTEFLHELRETLNAIFETYSVKRPTLNYRIIGDLGPRPDLWLPEQEIANHERWGRPYFDSHTGREIPLRPVIVEYHIHRNQYFNIRDINHSKGFQIGGDGNVINYHDHSMDEESRDHG